MRRLCLKKISSLYGKFLHAQLRGAGPFPRVTDLGGTIFLKHFVFYLINHIHNKGR